MARRRIPKGQINRKNKQTVQALVNLMEDLGQKYSIRVGIIGDKAYEKHPHTDLTMAELGAIHEFGATIEHPGGTPYYTDENGKTVFVSKDKGADLPKTKPHTIIIPTRSFLRMPLLNGDFKAYLLSKAGINDINTLGGDKESKALVRELNADIGKEALNRNSKIMEAVAKMIGGKALAQVQRAFESGGFGKWAPISDITKRNRRGDGNNPPLDDTGVLKDSITVEVKKVN